MIYKVFMLASLLVILLIGEVGEVFAKITPKKVDEPTSMYVVQKGDTLSELAVKYFTTSKLKEFEKYNEFSNIHLIFPGEKLQVPPTLEERAKMEAEAKKKAEEEAKRAAAVPEKKEEKKEDASVAELRKKLEVAHAEIKSLKASMGKTKDSEMKVKELKDANEKLHNAFIEKDKQVSELKKSLDGLQGSIQAAGNEISKRIEMALSASKGASAQGSERSVELNKIYTESEEISAKVEKLESSLSMIGSQVGSIQNSISAQEKEMSKKPSEEEAGHKLSKKAKTTALITTLIGAAIWVVANAVSSTK